MAKFGYDYFSHHLTTLPSLFHQDSISLLNELHLTRGQKITRIAPRGSAKTTWHTSPIYPTYCAAYELEPYIIIISDVQTNANKFLKGIKEEIEYNESLRAAFPKLRPAAVWREEAIELTNGVRIEAMGKGGRIRGRKHRQYRPTLIVCDDLQNLDDVYSELQMDKDWEWLNADVLKAGSPDTNYLVLGTALARKCIVCRLETTPGWKFKRYSSLIQEPTKKELWKQWESFLFDNQNPKRDESALEFYQQHPEMDDGSSVLWKERFPLYWLMQKRASEGERAFMSEEQGYPMPPGEAEWPASYFDHADFYFDEWPDHPSIHTLALDPSKGKDSKQGDFQGFVRMMRDGNRTLYVEAWQEKFDSKALSDFLVSLYTANEHSKRPVHQVALEVNGFQELLRIPIAQAEAVGRVTMPIAQVNNTVAKVVRIRTLTPYLAQKQIRFKRGSRGTLALIEELKNFRVPQSPGTHDDLADALEMALRVAVEVFNKKYQGNR